MWLLQSKALGFFMLFRAQYYDKSFQYFCHCYNFSIWKTAFITLYEFSFSLYKFEFRYQIVSGEYFHKNSTPCSVFLWRHVICLEWRLVQLYVLRRHVMLCVSDILCVTMTPCYVTCVFDVTWFYGFFSAASSCFVFPWRLVLSCVFVIPRHFSWFCDATSCQVFMWRHPVMFFMWYVVMLDVSVTPRYVMCFCDVMFSYVFLWRHVIYFFDASTFISKFSRMRYVFEKFSDTQVLCLFHQSLRA